MSTIRCIYCLRSLPKTVFSREHVIPRSLGTFENNLTLPDSVCSDCNQIFGNRLEPILAEGSLEAVLRLQYQIKPPESAKYLRKDLVHFSLSAEGDLDGLILELRSESGSLVVVPVPQVGFPRDGGPGWVYIPEWDLADHSTPLPRGIDTSRSFVVFASERMKRRLLRILSARGIEHNVLSNERSLLGGNKQHQCVEVGGTIRTTILRCVAKIALNYLALTAGSDFAAQESFNGVRSYVRYGTNPGYRIVSASGNAILEYDTATLRQTKGHLITLDWSGSGQHIVAQVGLFNTIAYRVVLTQRFSGVWRPVRSRHHFDVEQRRVQEFRGIRRSLL